MNANSPAMRRLDWSLLVAVALVACSWFLLNSLTTDLGFLQLQFRFYNVLALMHAPRRIITGADGAQRDSLIFGAICVVTMLAALAPLVLRRRVAWLGCVAPFALMAIVAAVLYHQLSQDMFVDHGSYGDNGTAFIKWANSVANSVGGMITKQIHVGAGGYLALAATFFLAIKGLLTYLNSNKNTV